MLGCAKPDKKSANAEGSSIEGGHTVAVTSVQLSNRHANATSWKKGGNPTKGRHPGTLNKITRTMKDAAVAAAEELGHIPYKQWAKQLAASTCSGPANGRLL
jgi:hypothetical protein